MTILMAEFGSNSATGISPTHDCFPYTRIARAHGDRPWPETAGRIQRLPNARAPARGAMGMTAQGFGLVRAPADKFHDTTEPATHTPGAVGGTAGRPRGSASLGRNSQNLLDIPKPAWRAVLNQWLTCATWDIRGPILSESFFVWRAYVPGHVLRPALATLFIGAIEFEFPCLRSSIFSIAPTHI